MKRNIIETVLGAVVLVVAAAFLVYSSSATDAGEVQGYDINVAFNEIGGLKTGDDVRVGGVKIGTVKDIALDTATYRAKVTLSIKDNIKLPDDTAARVSSEGLMGGNYLALDPGGDEENLRPGATIAYSQDAQNLESLLGKFIFSMGGDKDKDDKTATAKAPSPPPAPAAVAAPSSESTITPPAASEDGAALPKM
jgi:phospholipid/cholesterol/gamma-HCH transport system substrate-binding protein